MKKVSSSSRALPAMGVCAVVFGMGCGELKVERGEPLDACDPNPCTQEHETQCDGNNGVAVCRCDAGYVGEDCHHDWCLDNTCASGSCENEACVCSDGWTGILCDTCDTGYLGEDCHHDWCLENTCEYGSCKNEACVCPTNWSGPTCELASPVGALRVNAWIGASDTEFLLPQGSEGLEIVGSTQPDCDVADPPSCADGEQYIVPAEYSVSSTAARLGRDGFYGLRLGDSTGRLELVTGEPPAVEGHRVVVFHHRFFMVGGLPRDSSEPAIVWSSTDGRAWSLYADAPFPARQDHGLAVFQDRLWVVGGTAAGGEMLADVWSSADGVSWTEELETAPFGARSEHSLTPFAGKLWLIGGRDVNNAAFPDVWSSVDGVNWTEELEVAPFDARFAHQVLVYRDRLWLLTGRFQSGQRFDLWSSADGVNWEQEQSQVDYFFEWNYPATTVMNDRMWKISSFSYGSYTNSSWWSTDGIDWNEVLNERAKPRFPGRSKAVLLPRDNNLWLLGGVDEGGPLVDIWSSPDGDTWEQHQYGTPHAGGNGHVLTSFRGLLVRTGGVRTWPRAEVWTSENGLEWTNRTTAAAFGARSEHAVTEHAGQLWLVGGRVDDTLMSDVWVSSDAVEWTRFTDDADWSPRAEHSLVSHDGRLWVLGGTTQDPAAAADVWSSADGFTWERETADGGFAPVANGSLLSFAGDLWLLSDSHAWWSSDGRTWTEVPATVADGDLSMYDAVVYDGRIWLFGGFDSSTSSSSSEVWSSLDAITWTLESPAAAFSPLVCPQVVAHDGALFLTQRCDGGRGEIWRSADGVDWRLGNSQLVTLAPCVDGTVCTPSNVCMKGRIECNGGVPICVETGYQTTGTECGADSVCVEGVCTPPSREPALPPPADLTFDRTWEPQLRSDCDPDVNRSPGLVLAGEVLTEEGTHLAEPGVLFADETFTLVERHPAGPSSMVIGDPYVFEVYGGSPGDWEVYDDGTHGDVRAGDGLFTRACLSLPEYLWPGSGGYIDRYEIWFLSPDLRGTESVMEIAPGLRRNETGYFMSLGDAYKVRRTTPWDLFNPHVCIACQRAWADAGDIFDFFAMQFRDTGYTGGYSRVHDFIEGTGLRYECAHHSHCWPMVDGKEHPEYVGIIAMGWPGSGSITHELGHALLGMSTEDFPEPGEGEWNHADGMHIDNDVVATGVLAGPVWDPVRGFPHPVVVEIDGVRREVYVVREPDGTFVLQPIDDAHGVWADIFLYMMGILTLEETNETYYKLVNPSLSGCWSDEWEYVCPEGTVVQPERVIEFSTDDLVAQYGPWSAHADFTPRDLELGVLNISDRRHTEAEITWFSRLYREFAQETDAHAPFYPSTPWRYSTRGLGQIDVDPSN